MRHMTHLSPMLSKIVLRYIYAHVVTLLDSNEKYISSYTPVVRKADCGSKVVLYLAIFQLSGTAHRQPFCLALPCLQREDKRKQETERC